jgi:hypothetical protein
LLPFFKKAPLPSRCGPSQPHGVSLRFKSAARFAACTFAICLFGQRFALPLGSASVDIAGPACLVLAGWSLARGTLVLHRRRLLLLALLAAWVTGGALWQALYPNSYGVALNTKSLAQFLLLTSFAALAFAQPMDEAAFFRGATDMLALIAVAGIIQFLLQFVGAGLFSFTGLLPDRILYEAGYNLVIPVGIGDVLKSNGFFLLEPSIFSQAMAMALMLEILTTRRAWLLALFLAALVLSFSGTGWIVLATFLLTVAGRLGRRGVLIAATAALALMAIAVFASLLSPDVAAIFSDRFAELSQPGTSGNLRFATPFQLMHDVLGHESNAWLFGIGAGASERLDLAYDYNVNTPIKIMLEYGLPALLLYVAIFLTGERTRIQAVMVPPAIVLVMLTGGYQEFAPVLFPVLLLIAVARLRPAGETMRP